MPTRQQTSPKGRAGGTTSPRENSTALPRPLPGLTGSSSAIFSLRASYQQFKGIGAILKDAAYAWRVSRDTLQFQLSADARQQSQSGLSILYPGIVNSEPQQQSQAKARSRKENKWGSLCGLAPLRDRLCLSRLLRERNFTFGTGVP
jgi:hypothetical protein